MILKVNKYLNVHLVENYNVGVAEKLIPQPIFQNKFHLPRKNLARDMKFMLNMAFINTRHNGWR